MKKENGEQCQNIIKYYSNANNGMFSTVTIIIIEANRAIIQFLWFQFKDHIVETEKDQRQAGQSHGKYSNLRETEETVIVCFEEEIRRDKIKAHKPITNIEKDEKH